MFNIIEVLKDYPAFLRPHDLVALGIYPSVIACKNSRYKGTSPDYVKTDRKVLYPKNALISWISKHYNYANVNKP
jgi:hypothetical protein